jgi:hypothetical protein
MENSKMTPKEIFEPYLFSDQHDEIEKEYSGFHEAVYAAMEQYAEQSKAEQKPSAVSDEEIEKLAEKANAYQYLKTKDGKRNAFNEGYISGFKSALQTNVSINNKNK